MARKVIVRRASREHDRDVVEAMHKKFEEEWKVRESGLLHEIAVLQDLMSSLQDEVGLLRCGKSPEDVPQSRKRGVDPWDTPSVIFDPWDGRHPEWLRILAGHYNDFSALDYRIDMEVDVRSRQYRVAVSFNHGPSSHDAVLIVTYEGMRNDPEMLFSWLCRVKDAIIEHRDPTSYPRSLYL